MRSLPGILALLVAIIPVGIANRYKGENRVLLTYGSLGFLTAVGVAVLGGDRRALLVLLAAIFAGLLSTLSLQSAFQRRKAAAAAREDAMLHGVRIDELNRAVPVFRPGGRSYDLKSQRCTRYSLSRTTSRAVGNWSFLMRTKKDGAQYPHGFFFKASGIEPPDEMKALLTKIAKGSDEEYLEFEGSDTEVSAFWNAWGDKKEFERVHSWLQQLARF